MKTHRLLLALAVLGAQALSFPSLADSTSDQIEALKKQIEALTEKVLLLEKQVAAEKARPQPVTAIDTNAVPIRAVEPGPAKSEMKPPPLVSIDENGFLAQSANSNFAIGLHGHLQIDTRSFVEDGGIHGNSGFLVRRARPIIEGTFFRDFKFYLMPDFGSGANGVATAPTPQIYDAYLSYSNSTTTALRIRAGKFKSPVGLEQLQDDINILFNERALVTDLVPTRDLGLQIHGEFLDQAIYYAAGIFNGLGDSRLATTGEFDDGKESAGRLFFRPLLHSDLTALKGLGLGVGGSYGTFATVNGLPSTTGGTLPGYATHGQQQFFAYNPATAGGVPPVVVADGTHWRLSPQAYYYYGPFGLMGEYAISDQGVRRTGAAPLSTAQLHNTAWQITGSYVLAGEIEANGFNGVKPKRPFDLAPGNWGALQLAARYAELDIDGDAFPVFSDPTTSAHSARAWVVGLNWYLNKNMRVNASFSRTTFSGGGGPGTTAPAIVTRQPENVFFTRFQFGF